MPVPKHVIAIIEDGSITESKLANSAVSTAKIQDKAVTAAKLADSIVGTLQLADGSVTTAKLADLAVTTAKLANGSVTLAKLDASVLAAVVGIDKAPARVATTGNIADLAIGAPLSVDGIVLVANDRVLVKSQTSQPENGVYRVTSPGAGANGVWSRDADADATGELITGNTVYVTSGTANQRKFFTLVTLGIITVGTTIQEWLDLISGSGGSSTLTVRIEAAGVHTVLVANDILVGDAIAGNVTFNLPVAAGVTKPFFFRKSDASTNQVVIDPNGAETINGSATEVIDIQHGSIQIASDGTNWMIIG